MKPVTDIPTKRMAWNKNPEAYEKHQFLLRELAQWCNDHGLEWDLPADRDGWDLGIDIIVEGVKLDLKTFGLVSNDYSETWDSPYYKGRKAPVYDTTETDAFVHVMGDDVTEWKIGFTSGLRTSMYPGLAPYYRKRACMTWDEFAHDLLCART